MTEVPGPSQRLVEESMSGLILHSRTEFEDYPEPERRRHMIRLWLTFHERRPLGDAFPAHNGYGRNRMAEVAFQSAAAA
jgi:hypothetical protein